MKIEWTEEKEDRLKALYLAGDKMDKISAIMGIPFSKIQSKLSKLRMKDPSLRKKPANQWKDEEVALLVQLHAERRSLDYIKLQFFQYTGQRVYAKMQVLGMVARAVKGEFYEEDEYHGVKLPTALSDIMGNPYIHLADTKDHCTAHSVLGNRLHYRHQQHFLDGKTVSVQTAIRAANAIIKERGWKQLGREMLWV